MNGQTTGNELPAELHIQHRAERLALKLSTGCDCWQCVRHEDNEFIGGGLYVLAGCAEHFMPTARELRKIKTMRAREVVPLRCPDFCVDSKTSLEELSLAAGGVLVLDQAEKFMAGWVVIGLMRTWSRMSAEARPHLLMQFHAAPAELHLWRVAATAAGELGGPLASFLDAASTPWTSSEVQRGNRHDNKES